MDIKQFQKSANTRHKHFKILKSLSYIAVADYLGISASHLRQIVYGYSGASPALDQKIDEFVMALNETDRAA